MSMKKTYYIQKLITCIHDASLTVEADSEEEAIAMANDIKDIDDFNVFDVTIYNADDSHHKLMLDLTNEWNCEEVKIADEDYKDEEEEENFEVDWSCEDKTADEGDGDEQWDTPTKNPLDNG